MVVDLGCTQVQVSYPWQLDSEHVGTYAPPQPHHSRDIIFLLIHASTKTLFRHVLVDILRAVELVVKAMPPIPWPQRFQDCGSGSIHMIHCRGSWILIHTACALGLRQAFAGCLFLGTYFGFRPRP